MIKGDRLRRIIERVDASAAPAVHVIKQTRHAGARLGVFAASFNPTTVAHLELMRRAADLFNLDEVMALAGKTNADKLDYECSLEDRLNMLTGATGEEARVSIALSSHAYYVDMVDAIRRACPRAAELHFIIGFDTFERVLDPDDRYTKRYHRGFNNRFEALEYLFQRSRLVVASRRGAGHADVRALTGELPAEFGERILYLDFPADLGECSSTEVRNRVRAGDSIDGLVPEAVERYIQEKRLYR